MTDKIIDEMRVPHGEEYSTAVDTDIRRHTICELNDKEISITTQLHHRWQAIHCQLYF